MTTTSQEKSLFRGETHKNVSIHKKREKRRGKGKEGGKGKVEGKEQGTSSPQEMFVNQVILISNFK
eukprot:3940854-Rhodomonas_salina.3